MSATSRAARASWAAYAAAEGLIDDAPIETPAPRRSKYGARKAIVDGLVFDSEKEAACYRTLQLRLRAGEIADLRRQTAWPLHIMELWRSSIEIRVKCIGVYRSDFDYLDLRTGELKVIDVKSVATRRKESYRLKKKIVEAVHGVTIDEV